MEALGAVADHEQIEGLFPTTYGKPRIELKAGPEDRCATQEREGGKTERRGKCHFSPIADKNLSCSDLPPGSGKALRVGVVLSGGQASGGHNVIAGT
eukprot:evm.model.NODE_19424_length_4715_cov_26.631813.1